MKKIVGLAFLAVFILAAVCGEGKEEKITVATPHPSVEIPVLYEKKSDQLQQFVITEYRSEESETFLWDFLTQYAPNEYVAAGIMGYFDRESCFRSDATAGWGRALSTTGVDHCTEFTARIDDGLSDGTTREDFIKTCKYQYGGYGLGQWSSIGMLEHFYDFAQEWGTSISDAEMQCSFVVKDIEERYPDLWKKLLKVKSAKDAGILIGRIYDGASMDGYGYIGQLAGQYYDKHAVDQPKGK